VPESGFSTCFDAELDMRRVKKSDLNAHKVVNEYDESKRRVFLDYGE
jgi:16S rRNA (cytosine1402-N4)-methyltransferase